MSNNKRRVYTVTFKQEAVQLAKTSGKTLAELERDLGLSKGLLKHWVRQAETDGIGAFPGHGRLPPAEEELRRLRRENEILRQERDILKKVVSIFSQEPMQSTRS